MLEDYAFLTWGLLELFSATQDPRWIEEARRLADEMLTKLWDKKSGGFFLSRAELIVRPKPTYDGAIPSGNSVAALALIQLGHLTGERSYTDKGEATLKWYSNLIVHHGGTATTVALQALDALLGPMREVVVSGEGEAAEAMLAEVQGRFLPRTVLIHRPPGEAKALVAQVPYVADQVPGEDGPNAYVCERYACKAPVGTLDELKALLKVENVAPPK